MTGLENIPLGKPIVELSQSVEKTLIFRNTKKKDLDDVLQIHREAFGQDEEANLVNDLLHDDSARPLFSLLGTDKGKAVGHVLFTRVRVCGNGGTLSSVILAPLAVLPGEQGCGVGGQLILEGIKQLAESKVDLVFVLGHPKYYPRFGFEPAGALGFEAPYLIPAEHAAAWMVKELRPGVLENFSGKIVCADGLNRPELWRE
jgi:putative acetyltransferase